MSASNTKLNLKPLLSFELQPPLTLGRRSPPTAGSGDDYSPSDVYDEASGRHGPKKRSWIVYIPTYVALAFILGPHIPLFITLVRYYLPRSRTLFLIHLSVTYTLTFIVLTCFLAILVRDPGPVDGVKAQTLEDNRFREPVEEDDEEEEDGEDISLAEALLKSSASNKPWAGNGERRWCQKGHRTYSSFVHLLFNITLLCLYSFALTIPPIQSYLSMTTIIDENDWTPYLVILLALLTFVFGLMIGSFWGYHVYLISTNQTTLEQLTPFILLRHIPPLPIPAPISNPSTSPPQRQRPDSPYFFPSPPPDRTSFSESSSSTSKQTAPSQASTTTAHQLPQSGRIQEHLLSSAQRRRIRYAARKIRLYDLGSASRNWDQVFGGGRNGGGNGWKWWLNLILLGGRGRGDGYSFEFNPTAKKQLDRLAEELAKL
ncbi:palmitoyltransferase for Vac8p [Tulasnella sp. 425]|nr:palmitoyltransferase for Vac8p [Tulasnella sp. 425]